MSDTKYLKSIKTPKDLKKLSDAEIETLAAEIREVLIETLSKNGGHLASNLGVVELTLALHSVFNSPYDHIVWDVGHQIYTHKLLTGRFEKFNTIRKQGGLSGFSRPNESEYDVFFSGHSGTALSSTLGIAQAKQLKKDNSFTVAVIGDGSFTGGLVYEAINNLGRVNGRFIVVLNENEMSISKNVGSLARYLAVIRSKPRYYRLKAKTESALSHIPFVGKRLSMSVFRLKTLIKNAIYKSTWFEEMGFRYIGPIDGHNIRQLTEALNSAKMVNHPVLLHVYTVKGKGCDFAEREPTAYHGISKFDIETGEPIPAGKNFSAQFGEFLCDAASKDRRICAITAAMSFGTGLDPFKEKYENRFFDVGIAEEHAVTFASGLAKLNMVPVFAVYSTFLQRCYDQLLHDAALQKLKIIIAIDRAGFVGEDGEAHQGIYDVAFLNSIPDITVYSPSTYDEMKQFFADALYRDKNVVAVRYPRGSEGKIPADFKSSYGSYDMYGEENARTVLVVYGRLFSYACEAAGFLRGKGINTRILKLNRIKPIDKAAVEAVMGSDRIFFFEEGVRSAGAGEKMALELLERGYRGSFSLTAADDCFVEQGPVSTLLGRFGLDTEGIVSAVIGSENIDTQKET